MLPKENLCQNPECPKAGYCDGECYTKFWTEDFEGMGELSPNATESPIL